ncbi:MAG: hypothetical protein GY846_09305, partial [Deltaproteobacteria bacterium]|nr:hypothetical protein [Deltaproteobacteria bacterium]
MRPQACTGCHSGCRGRHDTGHGNESGCMESDFYAHYDLKRHSGAIVRAISSGAERYAGEKGAWGVEFVLGKQTSAAFIATDLLQKYGINGHEPWKGLPYLRDLNKMGVLGPGKQIDCDLPFDKLGEVEFAEKFVRMIAYREGIGDDIAEGFFRAAERWGRLEEDLETGLLPYPHWGLPNHFEPGAALEWGYGTIMGDRDVNEHDFNSLLWMASVSLWMRRKPPFSAEEVV